MNGGCGRDPACWKKKGLISRWHDGTGNPLGAWR